MRPIDREQGNGSAQRGRSLISTNALLCFATAAAVVQSRLHEPCSVYYFASFYVQLECGPMPNLMVALPNIGGALCSTPQSLADAHY